MDDHAPPVMSDPREPELLDLIARETGVDRDKLVPEAAVEELGIASLDMVQAIFAIESHYDIEIPVVADRTGSAEFATVGDLIAHILSAIDRKQGSDSKQAGAKLAGQS